MYSLIVDCLICQLSDIKGARDGERRESTLRFMCKTTKKLKDGQERAPIDIPEEGGSI